MVVPCPDESPFRFIYKRVQFYIHPLESVVLPWLTAPPLLPVQIINFREPATLDFLDAELEDSNKEEVSTTPSLIQRIWCFIMVLF